jgi:hypothetical protein
MLDDVRVTMQSAPPSPLPSRIQRPRWTDPRVIVGVVLVLSSVAIGAKVVSAADSTAPVWAATHDLAAGTVLVGEDMSVVRASLGDSAATYLAADQQVVGQVLNRQISRGELLPIASVKPSEATSTVTVPLEAGAAPKLNRGQRVQLWLSTKSCPAVLVLPDVVVQDVQAASGALGSSGGQHAVLKIPSASAERVVVALGLPEAQLRATVIDASVSPSGALSDQANGATRLELVDLASCTAASR